MSSKARELANLGNAYSDGALSNRNLIINGAMQVAQRGTSSTSTNTIAYQTVDRFNFRGGPTGVYTIGQDTDAPVNFKNSTKITVTASDTSIASGQRYWVATYLEGNDIAHLNFGSSDAQDITLSFYVKSSLTGTFSGGFGNDGFNRAYVFEYTINSANTWERKTVTINGDASGNWLTTNGVGLRIVWDLGAASDRQIAAGSWQASSSLAATGATQVIATNGATFYLTGVQLEVGDTATPFEHRSYGQELALCQRYFQKYSYNNAYESSGFTGIAYSTTQCYFTGRYDVPMRAQPSMIASNMRVDYFGGGFDQTGYGTDSVTSKLSAFFFLNVASGLTVRDPYHAIANGSGSSYLSFDAEL
jgi:hypothetical protein